MTPLGSTRNAEKAPVAKEKNTDRAVSRLCAIVTLLVLLALPSLRLIPAPRAAAPQDPAAPAGTVLRDGSGTAAPAVVLDDLPNGLSARKIRDRAMPLLARLVPGHGTITLTEAASRREGGGHTLWFVRAVSRAARTGFPDRKTSEVELRFDGETGGLIYARTICREKRAATRARAGAFRSASEADVVREARGWLWKLCLADDAEAPVVARPRMSDRGFWRVWLRGSDPRYTRAAPEVLTVQVTLDAAGDGYACAAVAERSASPHFFLPRLASSSGDARNSGGPRVAFRASRRGSRAGNP